MNFIILPGQKGFSQLIIILLLLLGIGAGLLLLQKPQTLTPKADVSSPTPQTMLGLNTANGKTEYESGKEINVFLVARADVIDVSEIKAKLSYDTAALEIKNITIEEQTDTFAKDPEDIPGCNSVPESVSLEFRQGQKKCKDNNSIRAKYKCGNDTDFKTLFSSNKCETLEEFKASAVKICADSEACKKETEKVKGPGRFITETKDKSFNNFLGSANIDFIMNKNGFKTVVSNPNASKIAKILFTSKPNSRTNNTTITIDPSATQFISKATGQPLPALNISNLTLKLNYTNDLSFCAPTGYKFTQEGCKGNYLKLVEANVTCGNGVTYNVPENSCRTEEEWLGKNPNDGAGYIDSAICKLPDPATGFARNRCAATNSSANNARCTLTGQATLDTSADATKDCSSGKSRKAAYQCAGNGASGVLGNIEGQCLDVDNWTNQAKNKCLESVACTGLEFKVTKVKISEDKPVEHPDGNKCLNDYTFKGSITANQAGTVQYRWLRSDNPPGEIKTLVFTKADTLDVPTDTWRLSGSNFQGKYKGWENLEVVSPNLIKADEYNFILKSCNPSN